MSTAEWALILTAAGGTLTWASYVARLLWTFRGHWDNTNAQLRSMAEQIGQLGARDDRIQGRLDQHLEQRVRQDAVLVARGDKIERRLQRHLDWHGQHDDKGSM